MTTAEAPRPVTVELSKAETIYAVMVGGARQSAAARQGRRNDAARPDADWQCHIEGALGELAVAKALGVFWAPNIGGYDYAGDVAGYHVRATVNPTGALIIHPKDPGEAPFVLVTGEPPYLHVRGWFYARDAKQTRYWRTTDNRGRPLPLPAYFVPAGDLIPFDGRPF